ncbi:transposase [Thalassospira sp. NFXS8]
MGRSCGGRTSKVHAVVYVLGRPLRLAISGGQLHDGKIIECFLNWAKPPLAIVVEKVYGSALIRKEIENAGALPVIPAKVNAKSRSLGYGYRSALYSGR